MFYLREFPQKKFLDGTQRYRIFFLSRKSSWVNQSIKSKNFVFFFFREAEKKKYKGVFFFFPEKVHEPFIQDLVGFSLFFNESVVCFFFSKFLFVFCVFFFFLVKVHIPFIQSISKLYFFFLSLEKKNTAFLIIQSIFPQNVEKMNFNRKKKKYDTFGEG